MTAFLPYPAYNPSGMEWLGNLPGHWEIRRLKFVAPYVMSKLSGKPADKIYLGLENVESGTGRLLLNSPTETAESVVAVFRPDDILFGKLRPYLAKVVHADFEGVCTSELLVLRPIDRLANSRFLFYLILSHGFISIVDSMTYGAKMPRANPSHIANLTIPLPPLSEQRAIAVFLDRETAYIDALIAKKRELIDLLNQQRTSIISHAVTKGLNPNAPMKPSGVEWLGDVPEGWEVRRLKFVTRFAYGNSLSSEMREDGVVPVFGSNGIVGKHTVPNTQSPCIIVGRKGSYGKINFSSVPSFAIDTTYFIDKTCTKANLKWLYYALSLLGLDESSQDSAVPGLSREFAYNRSIPFPAFHEQNAIAAFLDRETTRIDQLIAKIDESILLLQKQRAALISAAVTGKIDVRGAGAT